MERAENKLYGKTFCKCTSNDDDIKEPKAYRQIGSFVVSAKLGFWYTFFILLFMIYGIMVQAMALTWMKWRKSTLQLSPTIVSPDNFLRNNKKLISINYTVNRFNMIFFK